MVAESHFRLRKFDIDLIAFFQLALDDVEMLFADPVKQTLVVGGIVDILKSQILKGKFCKGLRDLIFILLMTAL